MKKQWERCFASQLGKYVASELNVKAKALLTLLKRFHLDGNKRMNFATKQVEKACFLELR